MILMVIIWKYWMVSIGQSPMARKGALERGRQYSISICFLFKPQNQSKAPQKPPSTPREFRKKKILNEITFLYLVLFGWNLIMEFERFFNEKDDRFLNDSKVNPLFDIGFIRDRNRKRKFEEIEERNPFKKRFVRYRKVQTKCHRRELIWPLTFVWTWNGSTFNHFRHSKSMQVR